MRKAAKDHVRDTGKTGKVGHKGSENPVPAKMEASLLSQGSIKSQN